MKLARRAGSTSARRASSSSARRAHNERSTGARRAASWMFAILHHSNDQIASSSSQLYERTTRARCALVERSSSARRALELVEPASSCKRGITHQLANYQLALTGQLSLDAFPNRILTDGQLTER